MISVFVLLPQLKTTFGFGPKERLRSSKFQGLGQYETF